MSKEQCPEIFADELAGIMLGFPVTKLTFAAAKQVEDDGVIEKTNVLTLTISTQSLLNACKLVLDNARVNQALILGAASTCEATLLESLQSEAVSSVKKTSTVEKKKPKTTRVGKGG